MMTPARAAIAAVLASLLLATSGCALRPSGTDGDLSDDWRPLAAPKFDVPAVGACLGSTAKRPFDPTYTAVTTIECDRAHTLEVVSIGTVEGNAAQTSGPPEAGSEGYQAAYTACGKAVNDYVGGDWHTGLLGIDVRQPTGSAWKGGLRSYLCSVFSISSAYGDMQLSTGTLKAGLAGDAPKAMRCLEVVGTTGSDGWWDRLSTMTPIDCAQPHQAEFAGTVQIAASTGGKLPSDELLEQWTSDPCWAAAARFVGLTEAQFDKRAEFGIAWDGMDKHQWNAGDRHQRCFALLSPAKKVRASIKGLGSKALPV
jgi:hypothetical protein